MLLKNDGRILPLDTAKIHSIAVIGNDAGPDAQTAGGGSANVYAPYVVTPYQGIAKRAGSGVQVQYAQGVEPYGASTPALNQAVQLAKTSDVAVVFASDFESEGVDLSTLTCP